MKKILIIILAAGGLMATNAISQTQENLTVVKEENVTIVTGQIVSVSTVDRTMTIKGNVRGQDNVYQVPETMKIIKNGREVRLRALTAGDLIEAKYYEKLIRRGIEECRRQESRNCISIPIQEVEKQRW